jgi:dipeptidyl aminopeptidase/acylaminoacyl peptidase
MIRPTILMLACSFAASAVCAQTPMTAASVLSEPFMNQLTAAPAKNRVAWFVDDEGKRNIWVASPTETAHAVTHNTEDDGQDISNIAWSPDSESLAYTHGTGADGSAHPSAANPAQLQGSVSQKVEIATVGGEVRVVGEGHAPVFSVDGRRLFYLLHGRVMVADLAQPDTIPQPLMDAHGSASALRPSPDGLRLAFVSSRGDHSFIGVFTFATKTLIYVDPGTGLDHDPVWSNDSKRIAFIRESPVATELNLRWMRSGVPWSIRIADIASSNGAEAWRADAGTGSLFHAVEMKNQLLWMADGRIVFPWEKTGWVHLYVLKTGERTAKELTPGEGEVENVATDGERIVYNSNQNAGLMEDIDRRHLWSVNSAGDKPTRLTFGQESETNIALLSDRTVSLMRGGAKQPFFPAILPTDPIRLCAGPPTAAHEATCGQALTPFPGVTAGHSDNARLVVPQQVIYTATDGMKIHAQLFLPKDVQPGTKLPAVVFFHGGSRRQMLLGYNPMQYYAQAYEFNQLLANHGYAVLSVNYRSGTGYGMEFRQAKDYGVFGASEYADVQGAALYLASREDIDAKHIGAWGGSYGGYLTALALARNSDLFAAGVDLHGVHDYAMEMELEKPNNDPTVDAKAMQHTAWLASPLADVKTWRSPVLLMQGDDDREVMFSNTVRLAAALREQGVHVEEKIFPDEVHDFLLHRDWVAAYTAALDFFDRTLKVTR